MKLLTGIWLYCHGGATMIFTVITEQEKLLPVYITGVGTQKNQEFTDRKEGYRDYQWTLCTNGKGVFKIGHKEYLIEEGMGFFFSPYIPHVYYSLEEPWETNWITFDGNMISVLLQVYGINPFEVFVPTEAEFSMELFSRIYRLLGTESLNRLTDASTLLYQILAELKKDEKLTTKQTPVMIRTQKLLPVIRYMEGNFIHDISLDQLSDEIHVTPHYLCKLFKQAFGISPIHYLIRIRLQTAKKYLILRSDWDVNTIARQVGYQDVSYFCSIFKAQEKMTPGEFRRIHGVMS